MMWLVLAIVVICFIVLLRNRSQGAPGIEQSSGQHEILLPSVITEVEDDEEYVIAVITAAIHEFTGTGEFEVVKIKLNNQNWILTGRQSLLANR